MHIKRITIRNLKSLAFFEVDNLPNLIVFAGPNGTGKSTVLDAIGIWKQTQSWYNVTNWYDAEAYAKLIRRGEAYATIEIECIYTQEDIDYLDKLEVENELKAGDLGYSTLKIEQSGNLKIIKDENNYFRDLLQYPNREINHEAPLIDYYGPHRFLPSKDFTTFNTEVLKPYNQQQKLIQPSFEIQEKAYILKEYLYQLHQQDLEWFNDQKDSSTNGMIDLKNAPNSFKEIREIVTFLLPHLEFNKVKSGAPIKFLFSTTQNKNINIDIDELSSGEKEVLSLFIEIYRKNLLNSIIIIDEPELHLNQAVESRIIPCIENYLLRNNQFFIVSHSSGVLSNVSKSNLYRINHASDGENQCKIISTDQDRIETLKSLVGDLSVFTTANTFVFLEGTSSKNSHDKYVMESFFPHLKGKVNFIPSGACEVVEIISRKVQEILESNIPFGDFYAIRDRDRLKEDEIQRLQNKLPNFTVWNRCMLENYLIDITLWAKVLEFLNIEKQNIEGKFLEAANNLKQKEFDLRISEYFQAEFNTKDFSDNISFGTIEKLQKLNVNIDKCIDEFEVLKNKLLEELELEISSKKFIKTFHGKNLLKELKSVFRISIPDEHFYPTLVSLMKSNNLIPTDMKELVNNLIK